MTAAVNFYGITGGMGGLCVAIVVIAFGLLAAACLKYLIR